MANRDIVAIGTSAGGVHALRDLVRRLPGDFPATVAITIHLPRSPRSLLDEILQAAGAMPAGFVVDGEPLRPGRIVIAPPDKHLIVDGERLHLGIGPRENNARPAIDAMLRSAAACCGPRTIGVVLTGTLGDGASGLWAVAQCGGITVVQDPRDAAFPEMPENAISANTPDHVVSLQEMPDLLARLVDQPAGQPQPVSPTIRIEVEIARSGGNAMEEMDRVGRRSVLTCPDCHGVMWEIDEGELVRYRCHVGHTYAANLMDVALDESLRRALASALRATEERVLLARRLQRQAMDRGHHLAAGNWDEKVAYYQREMELIRNAIHRMEALDAKQMAD